MTFPLAEILKRFFAELFVFNFGIIERRYREVVREEGERNLQDCETLRDFPKDMRVQAIRKGAILTSGALLIAIFTDMVGFLSFRFSDQKFLVDFGTVIAIGLVMIYFLSITLLPALLRVRTVYFIT